MRHWIGLMFAMGLGALAGGLNWSVIHSRTAPRAFIRIDRDLEAGEPIRDEYLERKDIRGDLGSLFEAALPYDERATLFNRPAPRTLHRGDLILFSDAESPPAELMARAGEDALPVPLEGVSIVPELLRVGDEIRFLVTATGLRGPEPTADGGDPTSYHYLGPFRILSVGSRLTRRPPGEDDPSPGDPRLITVAIKHQADGEPLDSQTRRLVDAIDAMKQGRGPVGRIVAIILTPAVRADSGAAGHF
jgi:hypothetical protein